MRAGSQVFALLMLFPCVILHTIWSCKKFVCEDSIGSVCIGGYCGQRKSELCVFGKLCPVDFLVVVNVRQFCWSL